MADGARYQEMPLECLSESFELPGGKAMIAWRWPKGAMMQMATGFGPGDGLEVAPCAEDGPLLELAPSGP
ncbi:hypothetical protein TYRP_004364 [Tyrophagus putrescentiae]|nr:hypothetical protein TYRP_004364 [Tyrophagus putrescentiae]